MLTLMCVIFQDSMHTWRVHRMESLVTLLPYRPLSLRLLQQKGTACPSGTICMAPPLDSWMCMWALLGRGHCAGLRPALRPTSGCLDSLPSSHLMIIRYLLLWIVSSQRVPEKSIGLHQSKCLIIFQIILLFSTILWLVFDQCLLVGSEPLHNIHGLNQINLLTSCFYICHKTKFINMKRLSNEFFVLVESLYTPCNVSTSLALQQGQIFNIDIYWPLVLINVLNPIAIIWQAFVPVL